jgi:hypothetical protein
MARAHGAAPPRAPSPEDTGGDDVGGHDDLKLAVATTAEHLRIDDNQVFSRLWGLTKTLSEERVGVVAPEEVDGESGAFATLGKQPLVAASGER